MDSYNLDMLFVVNLSRISLHSYGLFTLTSKSANQVILGLAKEWRWFFLKNMVHIYLLILIYIILLFLVFSHIYDINFILKNYRKIDEHSIFIFFNTHIILIFSFIFLF